MLSSQMSKIVCFLSMDDLTGFVSDDDLAIGPLAELGIKVQTVSWKAKFDWDQLDAVVLRTTWDYQDDCARFMQVLSTINDSQATLLNPLEAISWNIEKTYLRELEQRGIPIIPTIWLENFDRDILLTAANQFDSPELIIKPTISANADNTFRFKRQRLADDPAFFEQLTEIYAQRTAMLQPFIESVVETGEYSLFVIGDRVTHAILKKPKTGDFRVQEEHGGLITAYAPDPKLLELGERVLDALPFDLLYARIDCVIQDEITMVMEIELIEPALYFRFNEPSAKHFANVLASRLS